MKVQTYSVDMISSNLDYSNDRVFDIEVTFKASVNTEEFQTIFDMLLSGNVPKKGIVFGKPYITPDDTGVIPLKTDDKTTPSKGYDWEC